MRKTAISVTLDSDNLLWLQGRANANGARSLSETLNRLIADARSSGRVPEGSSRSVVGTIDLDPSDPRLEEADALVRSLFDASLNQPLRVHEPAVRYGSRPAKRGKTRRTRG